MVDSNERKRCLSGWLLHNSKNEYNAALKLQKFLFFYECFSKVSGEEPDFSHLRGYKRGPVFSQVWGDYAKDREEFNRAADESYNLGKDTINNDRAKKCAFVVQVLSESELSELTHLMNLWKAKEERILQGEYQVDLDENDFNENDAKIISTLDKMYPIELIDKSFVIPIDSHYFVFKKEDVPKLTEQHYDILSALAENEQISNPVYVEMDKGGRLVID